MDNSPRGTQQQHISLSSQISREVKSTAMTTATVNTGNFSPPVQATATLAQVTGRNSPSKEERLRLEESQRKEAEENRLRLQKEQEERAKVERAAEQKRLEEEKKKQRLLAKLKAIDNSQSTLLRAETKPASHLEETQPVKKKRLEDIFNDETTNDDVHVVAAKLLPSKSNNLEEKRKKDLLAQLLSTDKPSNSNSGQQIDTHATEDGLTTGGSSTSVKSGSSTGSNYKWSTRIENMHQGKPAMATKDDPFGARTSASLQQGHHNMVGRSTSQKQSDGGLDFLGGTGGVINTDANHSKKRDTPTFGRRAVQKPHAIIFGSDLTSAIDTPAPLKIEAKSANNNSSKSYPWEHEVDVTTERNSLSYLSHNNTQTDSSLLPRRIKAQPLNIGSMPGQIDDDIEELSLV